MQPPLHAFISSDSGREGGEGQSHAKAETRKNHSDDAECWHADVNTPFCVACGEHDVSRTALKPFQGLAIWSVNYKVSDGGKPCVVYSPSTSSPPKCFGSFGSGGGGDLCRPTSVAVDQYCIFVSDTGNDRIQVFRHDHTFLTSLGSSGSEPGQLARPMGLAIMERSTGERLLAVADCGNDRVQIFDLKALIVKGLIPGLPSTLPADMLAGFDGRGSGSQCSRKPGHPTQNSVAEAEAKRVIEEATTKAQQIFANAHVEAQRMAETARSQRT